MAGSQKVFLRIFAIVGDGDDSDVMPDRVPVSGSGRLIPTLATGSGDIAPGPDSIHEVRLIEPVPFLIIDGMLTYDGKPYIWLPVPTGQWQWRIAFDTVRVGDQFRSLREYAFPLTEATPAQIVDPGYPGVNIAQYATGSWEPGTVNLTAEAISQINIYLGRAGNAARDAEQALEDTVEAGIVAVGNIEAAGEAAESLIAAQHDHIRQDVSYVGSVAAQTAAMLDQANVFAQDQVPPYLQQTALDATYASRSTVSAVVTESRFGAKGDGTTDDTAAIQAAIDSLPVEGGTVFFPAGTYMITDAIQLRNALKIEGENNSSSVIYQVTPNKHGLSGTDILTLAVHNLRVVGPGIDSGTGIGIMLERFNNHATNYLSIRDVYIRHFGKDGIYTSNAIVSHLDTVIVEECGGAGFNIVGLEGVIGTSTHLSNCFANACGQFGYRVDTMGYSSFTACAADHNDVSYEILNAIGLTFNGCGSEGSFTAAWRFTGGYGSTITGGWVYKSDGIGVHVTGNAVGISVIGTSETSPMPGATAFMQVDAGSKASAMNLHNEAPNVFAPGTTQIINDVVGNTVINGYLDVQDGLSVAGVPIGSGGRFFVSGEPYADLGDIPNPLEGDLFLYGNSGDIFQHSGSGWDWKGSILGHKHTISEVDGLQDALDGKAATGHTHTKAQVGLGNVDNTSDAAKPISTAQQAALSPLQSRVGAAPATWRWNGTTLPTSAAQVHAQARVGDFIVAPNLTTDPGWHRIIGV